MRHFKYDAWLETADAAEAKAMSFGIAIFQSCNDNQYGISGLADGLPTLKNSPPVINACRENRDGLTHEGRMIERFKTRRKGSCGGQMSWQAGCCWHKNSAKCDKSCGYNRDTV